MGWINTIAILLVAFLAVFLESYFRGLRNLVGAQIDLLPALMVYASLSAGISTVALLAVLGGLWFDSLSANPLGITVLPLIIIGVAIYSSRDLILRTQTIAQLVLGLTASAVAPMMTLLLLLTTGHEPLFGWGTFWQLLVMTLGGAIATPVCFETFGLLNRLLVHDRPGVSSFRPDREIRRGRS